ncbi:MAG: 5'-methylthioadenosine/adenosylhomocysteine nucleosidase [Actinomycetota bacterium]|nr:5'-methylthioadenosine/adenosylhomocysteine nucleosidase [Actinomycetota bacterium]
MRKRIGVVVAMASEAQSIMVELFGGGEVVTEQIPYRYVSDSVEIGVVVSGIGKVNAAAATSRLISEFEPEEVVVIGLSGALTEDLSVGDIVIADKVVQYDFDLRPLEKQLGQLPGRKSPYLTCDIRAIERWIKVATDLCANDGGTSREVRVGGVATGDRIVSDRRLKELILQGFPDVICVEMESGAVGQVCEANGVPFSIVRVISDFADDTFTVNEVTHYLSREGSRLIERFISSLGTE